MTFYKYPGMRPIAIRSYSLDGARMCVAYADEVCDVGVCVRPRGHVGAHADIARDSVLRRAWTDEEYAAAQDENRRRT